MQGIGGGQIGPSFKTTSFAVISADPDGSLLAGRDGTLRRYLPNGALDPSFPPRAEPPESLPLQVKQPDGKILISTESGRIRRLNPDGTPDLTFHGGESEPTLDRRGWSLRITVLHSGKILVAGTTLFSPGKTPLSQISLTLLSEDGTIDQSFGKGGRVDLRAVYGIEDEYLSDLVADEADDGFLVVTYSSLVKMTAHGQLDPAYGSGGIVKLDGLNQVGVEAQPGDKLLVAGSTGSYYSRGDGDFFVSRYGATGQLDPTFAAGKGTAVADGGGKDYARSVLFAADGSILVGGAGTGHAPDCTDDQLCATTPAIARFTADGFADPGFGSGGVVEIGPLAAPDSASGSTGVGSILARGGGGLAVGGSSGPGASVAFLAVLGPTGALEPGFGSDGIVREQTPAPSYQGAGAVAVASDRKILVAGSTNAGGGESVGVFRYLPRGALDRDFGDAGFAPIIGIDGPLALASARGGGVIVLGSGGKLVRLTATGKVDPRFGAGQPVVLGPVGSRLRAVTILPSGKVLAAGTTSGPRSARSRMLAVRLLSNGRLDPGFGKGGVVRVGCRRRGDCAADAITVQRDGSILLAGRALKRKRRYARTPGRLVLARLLPDGPPDRGFGGDGLVTVRRGFHSAATTIALDGERILVAGWVGSGDGGHSALLTRFRSGGRLDRSFGRGGVVLRPGSGNPTAVLPTPGRIIVTTDDAMDAAFAYHGDGHLDRSFASLRLPVPDRKLASDPVAAAQGDQAVFAWTRVKGPNPSSRTQIELARLSNR
jgi:uncharacterized delta-60 repeat protein